MHDPSHRANVESLVSIVQPHKSSPNGLNAPSSGTSDGAGLFQETESARETPSVTVTDIESDTMTLVLTDASGHSYVVRSSEGVPATIQVPAGDYTLNISSSDPMVQTNTGDAVFRKHKQYSAVFHHDTDSGPVHLGDQ
jgi:hypothetical protein